MTMMDMPPQSVAPPGAATAAAREPKSAAASSVQQQNQHRPAPGSQPGAAEKLANKRVRFQLQHNQCYDSDYTDEEVTQIMWYLPRNFKFFKLRCAKDTSDTSSSRASHYEQVLKRTYAACQAESTARNKMATLETVECESLEMPLSSSEYNSLVKAMSKLDDNNTRIGLEKTTILHDRAETRKQLLSVMKQIQREDGSLFIGYDEEDDHSLTTQLCSLSEQMSRPARLFAYTMARALQDHSELKVPKPPVDGSPNSVMMLEDSSSHSLGTSSHHSTGKSSYYKKLKGSFRWSSKKSKSKGGADTLLSSSSHHAAKGGAMAA